MILKRNSAYLFCLAVLMELSGCMTTGYSTARDSNMVRKFDVTIIEIHPKNIYNSLGVALVGPLASVDHVGEEVTFLDFTGAKSTIVQPKSNLYELHPAQKAVFIVDRGQTWVQPSDYPLPPEFNAAPVNLLESPSATKPEALQLPIANQPAVAAPPATGWVKFFTTTEGTTGYTDTSSIQKNNGIVSVLWMSDLKNVINLSGLSIASSRFQDEFDCKEARYRRHISTAYSGNMGSGNVSSKTAYDSPAWVAVPPGGIVEAMRNYACGGRDQAEAKPSDVSSSKPISTQPTNTTQKLRELNALYKEGLIEKSDYETKKQEILKSM